MDIVYKIHVGPDNSADSHGNQEIERNEGFEEPAGDNAIFWKVITHLVKVICGI